jgi:Pectate lyase superfamily protein/Right handed beta helix region
MNKAITQGLVLMPPTFAAGLNLWSREDGRAGQGSYLGQSNAAYVPNDQDFAGCLELQKTTATQKLRCFQQIPFQPGLYLRVTVRIKAISGALPSVRIAGYAANSAGNLVGGTAGFGPSRALTAYGEVVTITGIIGSGNRPGVDMVWGIAPVYGHLGLDLTGASGGVVRIDDIIIEDVTSIFHSDMFSWVDVRDYGAIGDGVTDDTAAFEAADTAAAGKTVVVSPGTYYLGANMTFDNPVTFQGTVTMPASRRLACTRDYNLETYSAAFGSELEGFKRALQALFFFTDHVELDLKGRRVELTEPIDIAALTGLSTFEQRRVITNGQITAVDGPAWATETVTSIATFNAAQPLQLSGVTNIAAVPVGARISGTGVGREVYVTSKNVGAGTLVLSRPFFQEGTRSLTFSRFKYMLDFSGLAKNSKFEINSIEFLCNGVASCINLSVLGSVFRLTNCTINRPKDKGITSTGDGCQDLHIDDCQFISKEMDIPWQDRTTWVFNANANDIKIRNNRVSRFAGFGVFAGSGGLFLGNHFFGGDGEPLGLRGPGLVFTLPNSKSFVTGNYIDNCFIELTNEHDQSPSYSSEYSFGGLTIADNLFTAQNVAPSMRFIVITPRGPGHAIAGLVVTGNVFRTLSGAIDRVEQVNTSFASFEAGNYRNVVFEGNAFNGVTQVTMSPLIIEHNQSSVSDTWVVNGAGYLPFGGRARNVTGIVAEGAITNSSGSAQFTMPYVLVEQGSGAQSAHLKWNTPVRGRVQVTIRCDNPL